MQIVMPMAGHGSRFTKVGINTPKPLIEIKGKPMVQWAAESLPFADPADFIFIVRQDHIDQFQIDKRLQEIFSPRVRIIALDKVTEGAACTALLAKEYINNDDSLIITDCDHFFQNNAYNKLVTSTPLGVKGGIPVFKAEGEKWSFTKVDDQWNILQVAEKVRISPFGNIGAYFFTHGKDFVWAAEKMIREGKKLNNEYYICPVYSELLERGDRLQAALCEEVWGLGTPEDVAIFEERFGKSR